MKFQWDKKKSKTNRTKHGISFQEAQIIFSHPRIKWQDTRKNYGERRFITMGELGPKVVILIAYTIRNNQTRLISARKANKKEIRRYHAYIKKAPK